MISFMVVALPRSGTTWAANWLTTESTLCLHDPIAYNTLSELDSFEADRILGIADTGIFGYYTKLNKHPAKKVILHRDIEEINTSLAEMGLASMDDSFASMLNDIEGLHIHYSELFTNPKPIWDYLISTQGFDSERHEVLKQMQIQPAFATLEPIDKEAVKRYFKEIKGE